MRYVLALLAAVNAWGHAGQPRRMRTWPGLASLDNTYTAGSTYTVGSAQLRPGRTRTALVKEGIESPETIAAIEKNREDRGGPMVMDRR
jgi:hypothetical protein